jgi:uridine kinase
MPTPLVIGIAGGTASGKTTVARRIVQELSAALEGGGHETAGLDLEAFMREERQAHPARGRVVLLEQDSYYREFADLPLEEKREINWDHPEAFDAPLLVSHIQALKSGEPVQKPEYSFVTYARAATPTVVQPAPVLVVEGILVLGIEAIRKQLDVKISSTPTMTSGSFDGSCATSRIAGGTSTRSWSSTSGPSARCTLRSSSRRSAMRTL